jgi:rod shape determining protein RodA
MRNTREDQQSDWIAFVLFLALVIIGWFNIYAAEYDEETTGNIFSFSQSSGKQLVWIGMSLGLGLLVFVIDYRFFDSFAYVIYVIFLVLLLAVLVFGKEVAGSKSWFDFGAFRFQPSEFAKYTTMLALAKYLSDLNVKTLSTRQTFIAMMFFGIPLAFTLLQRDLGTALVFTSFLLVLFREGMHPAVLPTIAGLLILFLLTLLVPTTILFIGMTAILLLALGLVSRSLRGIGWVLILGVLAFGLVISVDFIIHDVMLPHQQKRVMSLVNPNEDPLGVGYHVNQSKIAIGSGGLAGKGYLQGTQTNHGFIPEQTTDFIFCTVGEEHGWIGSVMVIGLFIGLLLRLITLAERQKSRFARIFGYGVVAVIFFHMLINLSMTVGLFPVVGIPLPFVSYGGSSLLAFSLMLFTFLKLDAHRMQVLQR